MMTVALGCCDRHSVLEIGTGSGYHSAVLSKLARRVTTIDRFRTLVRSAERRWQTLGMRNVTAVVADGTHGWTRQAPFDRILLTASVAGRARQAHRPADARRACWSPRSAPPTASSAWSRFLPRRRARRDDATWARCDSCRLFRASPSTFNAMSTLSVA